MGIRGAPPSCSGHRAPGGRAESGLGTQVAFWGGVGGSFHAHRQGSSQVPGQGRVSHKGQVTPSSCPHLLCLFLSCSSFSLVSQHLCARGPRSFWKISCLASGPGTGPEEVVGEELPVRHLSSESAAQGDRGSLWAAQAWGGGGGLGRFLPKPSVGGGMSQRGCVVWPSRGSHLGQGCAGSLCRLRDQGPHSTLHRELPNTSQGSERQHSEGELGCAAGRGAHRFLFRWVTGTSSEGRGLLLPGRGTLRAGARLSAHWDAHRDVNG